MFNLSEDKLIQLFEREPIDIWINSFGGCRSNYIRDCIKDKYTTYNTAYELKACHYIRPLDTRVGSGIFCYVDDVGIALSSQLKRGMEHNYQKLIPPDFSSDRTMTIRKWLIAIEHQIDNWTTNEYFPTVIVNTDKIAENKEHFEEVFGVKLLPFRERTTENYLPEVEKEIDLVHRINEKLSELADFTFIDYPEKESISRNLTKK